MDYSTELNVLKVDNQNDFDWLYSEQQLKGTLTFTDSFNHSLTSFFGSDSNLCPHQNNQITHFEFKDLEDMVDDFCSWDVDGLLSFYEDMAIDVKPLNTMTAESSEFTSSSRAKRSKSISNLALDEIQKYFDVPITKAAKELKVGLTVLKKRCRELNITRWPHRKIKSLKTLIHNVKELGLTKEIEMLEEHKRMLETLPELELTERTKKLRQACFKANYKKRSLAVGLA